MLALSMAMASGREKALTAFGVIVVGENYACSGCQVDSDERAETMIDDQRPGVHAVDGEIER